MVCHVQEDAVRSAVRVEGMVDQMGRGDGYQSQPPDAEQQHDGAGGDVWPPARESCPPAWRDPRNLAAGAGRHRPTRPRPRRRDRGGRRRPSRVIHPSKATRERSDVGKASSSPQPTPPGPPATVCAQTGPGITTAATTITSRPRSGEPPRIVRQAYEDAARRATTTLSITHAGPETSPWALPRRVSHRALA